MTFIRLKKENIMNTMKNMIISFFLIVFVTIQFGIEAKDTNKQDGSAHDLIERCKDTISFESLDEFASFYKSFKQVDECLHSFKEPAKLCQDAEKTCEKVNIDYHDVRKLGSLIKRYKSSEFVCTIEFASKIYRLHKRLQQSEMDEENQPLSKPLRILGNRVASGCRKSLSRRLLEVEKRTTKNGSAVSESLKHLNAILSCLNVGFEKLEKIEIEPEQVNPIFTDDLIIATRANSIGRDGFEMTLNEAMQSYLGSIRASCSSLRTYQMNLLGSLGTLASVGYGFNPEEIEQLKESRVDKIRIHSWSLGAILCQSVSGVIKMSREKVDGRLFRKVKKSISEDPDVTLDEEDDTVFADYKLDEERDDRDLAETNTMRDTFKFDSRQINKHKKQLLQGPNYRMVRAILAYVNPMQANERIRIPYDLLGVEIPENLLDKDEDNEDDEEED